MASWKDFYGTKLLSAKALGNKVLTGKITACEPHTLKKKGEEDDTRLQIMIEGFEDWIRLNNTNATAISKAYGDDYTNWVGKKVQVKSGAQQYMGNATLGLFVTPVKK